MLKILTLIDTIAETHSDDDYPGNGDSYDDDMCDQEKHTRWKKWLIDSQSKHVLIEFFLTERSLLRVRFMACRRESATPIVVLVRWLW